MTMINGLMISLQISRWAARKHDREISREVARDHQVNTSDSDAIGRYNKVLVDKKESDTLTALDKLAGLARTRLYEVTIPLSFQGMAILPAVGLDAFKTEYDKFQWDYERLADRFGTEYPAIRDRARVRLNSLWKADDYPEPSRIRAKFSFAWVPLPIPDADQLELPSLSLEKEEEVRAQVEASMRVELANAARDPWERIYRVVKTTANKLRAYGTGQDGKVHDAFRDSLVGNVQALADILPRLNLFADPELDAMAERLTADLCEVSAGKLREDGDKRGEVARAAESMLADLAQYAPEPVKAEPVKAEPGRVSPIGELMGFEV